MKYEIYQDLSASSDFSLFDFVSEGWKGRIPKRASFLPTLVPGVYNLAFGDVTDEGDVDDYSISDNGDRNKILATVVKIVEMYTEKYPDRWIYFIGSTEERTRLYRMALGKHLAYFMQFFEVYAQVGDEFLPFQPNMPMTAFLIKRNLSNFIS